MYSVIFLVIKSDALLVFRDTVVSQGFQKVDSFVNDNWGNLSVFILQIEVVLWQLLDWEVGGTNGTFSGKDIGSFGDGSRCDVVNVWLVCFHLC
jgi:hypothetical protein